MAQSGTMRIERSDGNASDSVIGDAITGALNVVDYPHHEIHDGSHFYICGYETLGNGASKTFTVVTPNTTKWSHMTFEVDGTQGITFIIKEGATVSVAGTATTPINNNRNSATASVLTIRTGDTFSAEGTQIYGSHSGANKTAGMVSREKEIILKQNTAYIFRITNTQTTDTVISYCGEWYEHTNR